MRVFASVLLVLSTAFAYRVTYPGDDQGWNTTGPNYVKWERVDTDPFNFTIVLTNMNTPYHQILNALVDGTLGSVVCNTPSGGWPTGSAFRVNLGQDAEHPDSLLAQSSEFNITAGSSSESTTTPATQTATSAATVTATPSVSSSDTSTTPTGTSAASLGADAQPGLLTAALAALFIALF